MSKVHWFNPENDLALAADLSNYTPPRPAAALRRAGAWLPSLWAAPDDMVLVTDSDMPIPAGDYTPAPWGWSQYTRTVFLHQGANPGLMPSEEQISRIRQLSHRRSAAKVLRLCGTPERFIPIEATDTDSAIKAIRDMDGDAIVKLPWSCSGRGIMATRAMPHRRLRDTVEGMIRRQGSVMIEPRYERLKDFATLYYLSDGKAEYRGLSVFATDRSGNYTGNIIAPQSELWSLPGIDLTPYIESLTPALTEVFGHDYTGWAGVDMLSYRTERGAIAVAPCIEVNLRMTMGIAALLAEKSGRVPWRKALLRVALAGEVLPHDALAFSIEPPAPDLPLSAPVITITPESPRKPTTP